VPYNIKKKKILYRKQLYCRLYFFYTFENINLSSLPANRGIFFFFLYYFIK